MYAQVFFVRRAGVVNISIIVAAVLGILALMIIMFYASKLLSLN